jgi:hypothetical protein
MRILMNLCRILKPHSKLSFSTAFWSNTTITGGEVLVAAATQHTLQISIQHKQFIKNVKGKPYEALC